jgi:hypothetical protein
MKRLKYYLYILSISIALSLVLAWLSDRDEMQIIATWKQPDNMNYSSFDPYYLSVVTADLDWGNMPFDASRKIPFSPSRNYFIYVGSDSGTPGYGHFINFSFHPGYTDINTFIKSSQVEWTNEGVIFKPPSGHELKIPKKMFIGGR